MTDHNQKAIEQEANTYAETVDSMGRLFARQGFIAGRSKSLEEKEKEIERLAKEVADLKRQLDKYETDKYDEDEDHIESCQCSLCRQKRLESDFL